MQKKNIGVNNLSRDSGTCRIIDTSHVTDAAWKNHSSAIEDIGALDEAGLLHEDNDFILEGDSKNSADSFDYIIYIQMKANEVVPEKRQKGEAEEKWRMPALTFFT